MNRFISIVFYKTFPIDARGNMYFVAQIFYLSSHNLKAMFIFVYNKAIVP